MDSRQITVFMVGKGVRMQKNPFTLSFGRKPNEYIARAPEEDEIYTTFTEEPVTDQIHVITGVRGAGKTVAMTSLCEKIGTLPDWIVIKISPVDDILDALLKTLANNSLIHKLGIRAKFSISVPGISVSLENAGVQQNTTDAIDKMLAEIDKKHVKVLVAIDEVTDTPQMRAFISAFQLFITNNRPIYFLATALFTEIDRLQNVHNLTFLYRAPRSVLTPLNILRIAGTYQNVFGCTQEEAGKMAALTKGYPLAFQILGYVTWAHRESGYLSGEILDEFDMRLAESAYDKLWSELSETDRKVMMAVLNSSGSDVKSIRETAGMDSNSFNQYRLRLKKRGMINAEQYGTITFSLPRFKEYLQRQIYL